MEIQVVVVYRSSLWSIGVSLRISEKVMQGSSCYIQRGQWLMANAVCSLVVARFLFTLLAGTEILFGAGLILEIISGARGALKSVKFKTVIFVVTNKSVVCQCLLITPLS